MDLANLPVMPGGHGFFGHVAELRTRRLEFLESAALHGGELLRLRDFLLPVLLVQSPAAIHEVLVERAHVFDKATLLRFALYPLGGEGLFTAREPIWRPQRKLMSPLFHPKVVDQFGASMVACTDRVLDQFRNAETRLIAHDMTRLTMGIAGKTLFDADTFDDADEIGDALTTALDWTSKNSPSALALSHIVTRRSLDKLANRLPARAAEPLRSAALKLQGPVFTPGKSGRALQAAIATLDRRVQSMIDSRRAAIQAPHDLLSKLLFAKDETERGMSDKQIRDEILTLFIAGHETTAAGLAWTLYLLSKHPEHYARAQAEADAIKGPLTAAALPQLGFLGRAFKESLRLYPPVYVFSRQAMTATRVLGFDVPAETVALVAPYALHRRPDLWPDPHKFDPERFSAEQEAARSRYAWIPFGAGPRVCIGMQFAMMEAQLALARMLQRCRFEHVADEQPAAVATLRPLAHMPMRVHLRSAAN
jgi:cytochrome P450